MAETTAYALDSTFLDCLYRLEDDEALLLTAKALEYFVAIEKHKYEHRPDTKSSAHATNLEYATNFTR